MKDPARTSPATSRAITSLKGSIRVPGDKSISHRALMFSSQAIGTTTIEGLLEGEDVLATAGALRACGINIEKRVSGEWVVQGKGVGGLSESSRVLDMGNAGTGARLMMGLLASYPYLSVFTGDESLSRRPMARVMKPLELFGATFLARNGNLLPLSMQGTGNPIPIEYELPVASAQVKSAVLLAGLNTPGVTTVIEKEATRDHSERMFRYFGIRCETSTREDGAQVIKLWGQPQQKHQDRKLRVPTDPSSAAFPTIAALITGASEITIRDVCINPLRIGLYTTLKEMGANITFNNEREEAGEQIADIIVKSSALKGVEIPAERAPSMIDEYPVLAVAAAFAKGDTIMHGLKELRVKESDRLQAIIDGLNANGVKTSLSGDTLTVHGTGKHPAGGGTVTTHFDHRIAMSFLVMGMATENPVHVDDTRAIATSFPGFVELMNNLGADLTVDGRKPFLKPQVAVSLPRAPRRIIAIDGPAASGKGTLARRLAEYFGYHHLDTGSLYRAVGLRVLSNGKDPAIKDNAIEAALSISDRDFTDPRLRQEKVGQAASVVSAIPEVRDILLDYQRQFASRPEGSILDGRDIGTVVCPDADIKIFMTASIEARAKRRHDELQEQGIEVVFESVVEDLVERDERDKHRTAAPLIPAPDAIQIDTTNMEVEEVFRKVRDIIEGHRRAA